MDVIFLIFVQQCLPFTEGSYFMDKGFHSVPKTFSRIRLAAIHFNENSQRGQLHTQDGSPAYSVYYTKAAGFEPRVRQVATTQTYGKITMH